MYLVGVKVGSKRRSSAPCGRMSARLTASSLPTGEPSYPRAQPWCPGEFFPRPMKVRARWMAAFPLMKPTTWATEYCGGIDSSMGTCSPITCPSSIRPAFCAANARKTSPRCRRNSWESAFRRDVGRHTTCYVQSHVVWLRGSLSSMTSSLSVDL